MHGWLAAVLNLLGMGAGTPAVVEEIAVCGDFAVSPAVNGTFAVAPAVNGTFTVPGC